MAGWGLIACPVVFRRHLFTGVGPFLHARLQPVLGGIILPRVFVRSPLDIAK
jgi:hypothetical protein